MAFRSDHDAALARADALQRELDAAQQAHEQSEDELEKVKRENLALRAELSEPATKPKLPHHMRPMKPATPNKLDRNDIVPVGFAVFFVVFAIVAYFIDVF